MGTLEVANQVKKIVDRILPLTNSWISDYSSNIYIFLFGNPLFDLKIESSNNSINITLDKSKKKPSRGYSCSSCVDKSFGPGILNEKDLIYLEDGLKYYFEHSSFKATYSLLKHHKENQEKLENSMQKLREVLPNGLNDNDPSKLLNNLYLHFAVESEYDKTKERFEKKEYK